VTPLPSPFSLETVQRALGGATMASVEVVEWLDASMAEVARLRITPSDGGAPFTVIGKSAAGVCLDAARRELRFFERWCVAQPRRPRRALQSPRVGEGGHRELLSTIVCWCRLSPILVKPARRYTGRAAS